MNLLITGLLKGIIFGFTMAAVPGPIFFLIIQRTLSDGPFTGFLCGLGAITADMTYALIAAVGLTIVSHYLLAYQPIIISIGGLFLIYLGVTTYIKHVQPITDKIPSTGNNLHAWFSTFLLTLTSPMTIISYTIIFAGLDVGASTFAASMALVFGVGAGALLMVVTLIGLLAHFRRKLSLPLLSLINKLAGVLLTGFGVAAIGRSLLSVIAQ